MTIHPSGSFFLKPAQHIVSLALNSIVFDYVKDDSYRIVVGMLNRILHRDSKEELKATTIKDRVVSCGYAISEAYSHEAENMLSSHHVQFGDDGKIDKEHLSDAIKAPTLPTTITWEDAEDIINSYNEAKESKREKIKDVTKVVAIETSPKDVCYISIDDVSVKYQKNDRVNNLSSTRKYVENTVIHIQTPKFQYCITAIGMEKAFRILFAFLLKNNIFENHRFVFFTDGANNIFSHIDKYFSFREHYVILDWFHLRKRIKELLSMALKGKIEKKREYIRDILRILFAGNVEDAKAYLSSFDEKKIKNIDKLNEAINYLDRKAPFIACYALRARLHLRISSNRVEKANDMIVANRQKHNGMSWSEKGSGALAAITAAKQNGVLYTWICSKQVSLEIAA